MADITIDSIINKKVAEKSSSDVDGLVSKYAERQDQKNAVSTAISTTIDKNPDEMARYVRLYEQTGLDPEMLMEDPEMRQEAETRVRKNSINIDSMIKTNPRTARFMANPQNASVAHDDLDSLTGMEKAYRAAEVGVKGIRSFVAGLTTGFGASAYGVAALPFGVASQYIGQPLAGSVLPTDPFKIVESKFLELQQRAERDTKTIAGETGQEGTVERGVMSGMQSLGQVVPSLGLSMLTGNPNFTIGSLTAQTGGSTYGEAREKGLSPTRAAVYATEDMFAEYVTERIPVKYLLKTDAFKKSFVRAFANFQLKEGVTEQVATAWQDFNEWANLHPEKTLVQYLEERPEAAAQTAIATLVAGSGQAAIAKVSSHIVNRDSVENTKAFFDALSKGVTDSKLHKRLPQKTREFIANLKEDGDVKDVYIAADKFNTFFQSQNRNPIDVARELMGEEGVKQLTEASTLGSDFVIPLEIYAEKVAGSEFHKGLAADLRLRQGDMSENEYKLAEQNRDPEEDTNALVNTIREQLAEEESSRKVYEDLYAEAMNAGVPASQAQAWATIEAARYRTRAARLGTDAYQLWEQDGKIQVRRPGTEFQTRLMHGGTFAGGDLNRPLYLTDNREIAESYVDMANDRFGPESGAEVREFDVDLESPAPESLIIEEAKKAGINPEDGTPASMFDAEMHGEEAVNKLVAALKARGFDHAVLGDVAYGRQTEGNVTIVFPGAGINLSRTLNQAPMENEAFRSWFDGSQVVDEQGQPLVVYHGTQGDFDTFQSSDRYGDMYFFTPRADIASTYAGRSTGANVMPTYVSIKNPMRVENDDYNLQTLREARQAGHDGVIVTKDGQTHIVIPFDRTQIKSATGNQGTFDPENANILYQSGPIWYSELREKVKASNMNKGTGQQWAGFLKNLPGVKGAELEWSGIREWLDLQEGPVTKEQVDEFIAQNGVRVEEVDPARGEGGLSDAEVWARADIEGNTGLSGEALEEYIRGEGREEYEAIIAEIESVYPPGETEYQYEQYQLAGGKNYRELLLTLPSRSSRSAQERYDELNDIAGRRDLTEEESEEQLTLERVLGPMNDGQVSSGTVGEDYVSSHFPDQKNILAHIRFNERTDADGKRVLFIEEIQSDWAQEGKKKGFDTGAVPTAPFVQNTDAWVGLALKRMIRYAAENGFDRVAWTTGKQQADRYSLAKQVRSVGWNRFDSGAGTVKFQMIGQTSTHLEVDENLKVTGGNGYRWDAFTGKPLDEVIGKDLAKKYAESTPGENVELSGDGLEIGGEGMKTFYDRIVPKVAKSLLKKFGGGDLQGVDLGGSQALPLNMDNVAAAFFDAMTKSGTSRTDTTDMWEDNYVDIEREMQNHGIDGLSAALYNSVGIEDELIVNEIIDRFKPHVNEQPGFDITPKLRETALAGMPLFQKERGAVTLAPGFRQIQLLENADLSTFIHELGHTWLEELQRDAARADAPQQIKDDWAKMSEWLGIEPDGKIEVESHEKFARATEAYFMEGKSPAVELMPLFQRFKAWLKSVYKSLTELRVNMNDEVRAVFDRLIATDEEIERAEIAHGMVRMFSTPEEAGMTNAEFEAYAKVTERARVDAEDELTAEIMKEIKREEQRWWKSEKAKIREDVAIEAQSMSVYRAIWELSRGQGFDGTALESPVKLSKEAVASAYGADALKKLSPHSLRTAGWVYAAEGGMHPDTVARLYGFKSGKELIDAMTAARPMQQFIEEETDKRMTERHGSMLDDGSIADRAVEAVHNDRRVDSLEIELRILRRKRDEVRTVEKAKEKEQKAADRQARRVLDFSVPTAVLREAARNEIGALPVYQINPSHYQMAEIRAAREAVDKAAKKDYAGAAEAKQRQILNLFFFREATKARREAEAIVRRVRRISRDSARARIGKAGQEWLEQLDAILGRYSLGPVSQTQKARTLVEWLKNVKETTGEDIAVAPRILDEGERMNYRELPMDGLRALWDTIASIQHVARKINTVIRNGEEYDRKLVTDLLVEAVHNNVVSKRILPETDKAFGQARSVWEKTQGFFDSNIRPEKIIETLDGGKSGIWHDMLWNPSIDAQTRRDDLRHMIMLPLAEFTSGMPKDQAERMNERIALDTLGGRTLTRRTLIGIALNIGNASNRDKLQRGGLWMGEDFTPITNEMLVEMMDHLNETDWQMVQTVWDAVEKLYPYLDDLNKRAVGLPLSKIEATPIETKYGVFRGGYWPAVADPRHSTVGERQENSEQLLSDLFAPRYPTAATSHSFREERTQAAYPIQLDWERVLANHVSKAVTDIAYHEWVKQTRRILKTQGVKKAIQNSLGENIYRALEEWLVHQVQPIQGGYMANRDIDALSNQLISNTVVFALGFKAATAIGNMVVAPVQASHQVRPDYMIAGIGKFLSNPRKSIEAVHALSGEMRHRFEHYEQTFNNVLHEMEGKRTIRHKIAYWAMMIHLYADRITSTAIWMAKYHQEIDKGRLPEEAMRLADKTIRTTQTAAAPKDLSSFERDPRYKMFKMFIGPMIIMQNEMRGAVRGKGMKAFISGEVWATMFATWIIPSMLFELAVGRGPEDDEEWGDWALRKILLYPAMTLPYIRDAASIVEQHMIGRDGIVRSNPFTDVVLTLERSVRKAVSENADVSDIMNEALRTSGVLVGLPTNQLMTTASFLNDVFSGEYQMEGPEDLGYLIYRRRE